MKPVRIFEDNNGNRLLTKEAFEEANIKFQPGIEKYEKGVMVLPNKPHKYKQVSGAEFLIPDSNGNLGPLIMCVVSTLEKDINARSDTRANRNITNLNHVTNFLPAFATIKNLRASIAKAPSKNIYR